MSIPSHWLTNPKSSIDAFVDDFVADVLKNISEKHNIENISEIITFKMGTSYHNEKIKDYVFIT